MAAWFEVPVMCWGKENKQYDCVNINVAWCSNVKADAQCSLDVELCIDKEDILCTF